MNKRKKWITIVLFIFDLIIVFGGSNKNGIMYNLIGHYLANFMVFLSHTFGSPNGVGFAIITLTVIFRLLLMPVALNQLKVGSVNRFRGEILKPEISYLQESTRTASDPKEQELSNTALVKLYDLHKFSPFGGISFISILIQIPFMSGVYSAINNTPALKESTFFNLSLNDPNLLISILVFGIYFLESFVSSYDGMKESLKNKKFSIMIIGSMLLSPVLMFLLVYITKGAFGLYFIVNGLFVLIQNTINRNRQASIKKEVENNFHVIKKGSDILQELKDERKQEDQKILDENLKTNDKNVQ